MSTAAGDGGTRPGRRDHHNDHDHEWLESSKWKSVEGRLRGRELLLYLYEYRGPRGESPHHGCDLGRRAPSRSGLDGTSGTSSFAHPPHPAQCPPRPAPPSPSPLHFPSPSPSPSPWLPGGRGCPRAITKRGSIPMPCGGVARRGPFSRLSRALAACDSRSGAPSLPHRHQPASAAAAAAAAAAATLRLPLRSAPR